MSTNTHEKLGNYHLVRRLGAGGFSKVYLGEHLYLKTSAAVKVLHSRLFSDESLNQFLTEARLAAQLDHPHIVRVLEFGVEEHVPYLVLQYAPNGTVRQRHPKGSRIPLPTIVRYVRQIAEALQYAHELKIIHRDIKPENFLLGKNGEILLGDFGLATLSQSAIGLLDHERAGTAEYMAPEQSQGRSSRASDQYALGIVVYEWLCGCPPFRGTDYEILNQHIYETPLPLHEMVQGILPAIEQVVMRTLAKEPSERFPQIQDFALALEAAYHQALEQLASEAEQGTPAPELSSSKQEMVDVPSQDQPQLQEASRTTVNRSDSGNVQQQVEHISDSGFLPQPSILPEEQTAIDPAIQTAIDSAAKTKKLAAVHPTKQQRRMSRRTVMAAGILGLVALGGGAAGWYLLDSSNLMSSHSILSRARTAPTGTTFGSPVAGTPKAGGTGHSSTNSPSPTPRATVPLTLQIGNAGALAEVHVNSTNDVVVTTSQPGIPTTVQVTYSNGDMQTLGPRTTDGNGNVTFAWRAHPDNGGLGKLLNLSATLVASATGANGQIASSAPVNVKITLLGGNG